MMRINTEMLWLLSSPALEVLIVLLMCGAYLAFINPQTLQAKSATFFLLKLGIPGNNCNVFVSCGRHVCLIDNIKLVEISGCSKLDDIQMYGLSKRDPSY